MRRIVVTVAIAAALLVAVATPASAHTVAGSGATNYRTTMREVSPKIDGLSVKVIESGSRIEASYAGPGDVFVIGYQEEPFLRIGKRGVFENLKSPATYINKTRDGITPPADADPKADPVWRKISSGSVARWHDHRVHFMGETNPPQVRNAPEKRHVISADWQVTFVRGEETSVASGDLVWVPGPSPAPMFALAVALVVGLILAAHRKPYLAIGAAVVVLVAVDIVHAFGIGFANAGGTGTQLGRTLSSSTVSLPAWIVGGGALWFFKNRKVDGFFASVFVGLIVAVVGGIA
ncbi:MAG: hypothetical protein Q8K63_01535, partial [Acidimicrobiales bacterium]|nr:hypothetical protein [Acidimicrobiales bacterium]